jgi:hypothetical protein
MSCASGACSHSATPCPGGRDRVQVDARDDVTDSERDRLGVEHDGMRRSCVRALQPQVLLVESSGALEIAHLQ